jgi:riboflavin biosynthesis pyrimidine reductase
VPEPSPLEVLWEAAGLPALDLPAQLAALYGGTLGFDEPRVVANFVESIDGVVAIPSLPGSNKLIAGGSASDRFVMGLLRACADVVTVGSGTIAASPRGAWTAEQACPAAADAFAELRRRLGKPVEPRIAVLTRSGAIDPSHPVFAAGAEVLTSDRGAARLAGRLPEAQIVAVDDSLDPGATIAALRARGDSLILSEGGPTAIAPFLEAGLVDELFLTLSPLLTGRIAGDRRLALVEGSDLVPGGPLGARLLGVRRDADHLFLRYELETTLRTSPSGTIPTST